MIEQVKAAALRLLVAEDARQSKLHEILETIREQIRVGVPPEHRPDGLFKNIQDAVYAMRGRTVLLDDAAIVAALAPAEESRSCHDHPMNRCTKENCCQRTVSNAPAGDAGREADAYRWRHGCGRWEYGEERPAGPSAHLFEVEPLYHAEDRRPVVSVNASATSMLLDQLLSRLQLDGIDPDSLTIGEIRRAV